MNHQSVQVPFRKTQYRGFFSSNCGGSSIPFAVLWKADWKNDTRRIWSRIAIIIIKSLFTPTTQEQQLKVTVETATTPETMTKIGRSWAQAKQLRRGRNNTTIQLFQEQLLTQGGENLFIECWIRVDHICDLTLKRLGESQKNESKEEAECCWREGSSEGTKNWSLSAIQLQLFKVLNICKTPTWLAGQCSFSRYDN